MKVCLLFLALLFPVSLAFGQKPVTFQEADTSTYSAYLNSDWDRILEVGNRALESNIDYYYLRLRIAYAYFMKSQYAKAIPHYMKALEFSNNDAISLEYLYYCYRYTGRNNDAEKLVSRFSPSLKSYLHRQNTKHITGFGFYTTFGTGADSSLKSDINMSAPTNQEGSQIFPNSFTNVNIHLGHRIGYSVILRHSLNLLYKNEYAFAVVNSVPYISEAQTIRQFNYHIAADITPFTGFTLSPVFLFNNYKIPIFYEYGAGSGRNRSVYSYDTHSEALFGLKASLRSSYIKTSIAGSHSSMNLAVQNTASASLSVYPLGNLNLYLGASASLHSQKQDEAGLQQFIHSYMLGFRPVKSLWIEGEAMFGTFSNFYDPFSEQVYNSLELYKSIGNINLIVPFYKSGMSLFASYRYYASESIFVPVDDVFETSNHKPINYQSFTIGLSWKL